MSIKNKNLNMARLDKIYILLNFVIFTICLLFNIYIFKSTKDYNINISIATLIFTLAIFVILYLQKIFFKKYIDEILVDLSDMLSTISDMREEEIFSMIDDSIFSKLQHQTLKLINVLKAQNKKMENEKNEIKSLISDISHQLKTPLANMKMYSEFLQQEDLSEEERKEFYEIILLSLDKLCFLVESMIKMSRLDSSVINLHKTNADINDAVVSAISQLYKKAQLKNINIEFEQNRKILIDYDKKWTSEAIFNIIENAVKYSLEDTTIFVSIEKYEIFTRIDIKDQGIGISEEEIPKIFGRFYRGRNVLDEEGIGIGLYLSREIISKQGGYIKVKSSEAGSVFSIFLQN